jgi:hypothetical protein
MRRVRFNAHSGDKSNIARGPKSAREETSYLFGLDLTAFERSHSWAARNHFPIGVARRAAGTSRSSDL